MEKVEIGGNLYRKVTELIAYRAAGMDVYCEVNGHKLYSRNVTLDSAFLEITGYTYEGYLEAVAEEDRKFSLAQEREKNESKAKKHEWIERGKKLIDPEKWDEWMTYIYKSINGLYNGKENEYILQVMEAFEAGKPSEEIIEMLKKGPLYLARAVIETFYHRAGELCALIDEYNASLEPKDEGRKLS